MAASVRSTSNFVATASVTTGTVPMPTGWQPNDVMLIASVLAAATGTITAPSGYTEDVAQFHSSSTTSATMELCHRVLQSGDTAPAVTCKSGRLCCIGVAVQGADTTTPLDVTPTSDTNSGVSFPSVRAPSISPVSANTLLITFHGEYEGTNSFSVSFTPDASETEADDQSTAVSGSSNAGLEAAWQALSASGATGTRTATASTSSTTHGPMGVSVVIRSASVAGVPLLRPAISNIPVQRAAHY